MALVSIVLTVIHVLLPRRWLPRVVGVAVVVHAIQVWPRTAESRDPNDHINTGVHKCVWYNNREYIIHSVWCLMYGMWYIKIGILQTMISGIPLTLGLGTKMSDLFVYVAFWAPRVSGSYVSLRL